MLTEPRSRYLSAQAPPQPAQPAADDGSAAALAALFASDPEAYWARVGADCDDAALAAVRAACEGRPTEAGGDCTLDLENKHIGDGGAAALGRALARSLTACPQRAS